MRWMSSPKICLLAGFLFLLIFPGISHGEYQEADQIPWSGHWWPYSKGALGNGDGYHGYPAPIEKYELLTQGNTPGALRSWFFETHYNPDGLYWFGLCYEWAQAACYEDIRFFPSSENNIVFRVGDKKGLMTLAHESDLEEVGNGENPDEFHYWLLHNIKDNRRPFMADLDPTEEVWSYPIFSYDMHTSRSGGVESVQVTIGFADDAVHPDFMGTQKRHRTYNYDLWVDESGNILGGEWTGISKIDHPQRMARPLAPVSNAPDLDYETVRRLSLARDDFLEEGDALVPLDPGTYHLVLLDPDEYLIPGAGQGTARVEIVQQPGSNQEIQVSVLDSNGHLLLEDSCRVGEPCSFTPSGGEPPYRFRLTQADYGDPSIYSITLDVRKPFSVDVPFIPNGSQWSGFALTNPTDAPVTGIQLVTFGQDGRPIQTVMGPRTLSAGQKEVFLFEDLPFRAHERADTERLMVLADAPIRVLNLLGGNGGMACLTSGADEFHSRFVIPHTQAAHSFGGVSFGEILNASPTNAAEVAVRLFSAEGIPHSEANISLEPGETKTLAAEGTPFYHMPSGGWMEVLAPFQGAVSGFQYRKNGEMYEITQGLADATGEMMVPHVPPAGGYWETSLTVINLSDEAARVRIGMMADETGASDRVFDFNPREKRVIDIGAIFGRPAGDPLFRSILTVSGDGRPFAGFFTYSPRSGEGDSVSLPLFGTEHVESELVLSHCAGNAGQWWTGMVVANPGSSGTTVQVLPYNLNGDLMAEDETEFFLAPGRYFQGTVRTLLGPEAAARVSHIVFRSGTSAPLAGFVTYGNTRDGHPSAEMMTGAPM